MDKLSLYVVAMNEEVRLPRTLESVKDLVDEIVIVDSGSTDGTESVARRYGARFVHHDWQSIGEQVRFAEEQCSHRWVLRLDADEELSPALRQEILSVKERGRHNGYALRIGEVYPGMTKPNPWVKHYRLIRLYDREVFHMTGRIGHDDVEPRRRSASFLTLKNFVNHYSHISLARTTAKRNLATDRQVERAYREGKSYSPWRMVGALSVNFWKSYLIDRFFLLGWWGYIHAVETAHMRFHKFAKYYESRKLAEVAEPGELC